MNVVNSIRSLIPTSNRGARNKELTDSDIVRIDASETFPVSFTVNGKSATVHVSPRVTLSDVLRDHLGLTGTHVGCEHGVCGMCTVNIDGEAARACLVLACQVDGSEILTVEGLGTPDELHPLQKSFSEHHGLQCGFCTPGMLMSAYDMLKNEDVSSKEDIAKEMSGVLCRCTGYRNIIDSIADVAEKYPDGPPVPQNIESEPLINRSGGADGTPRIPVSAGSEVKSRDVIILPNSEPTMDFTIESQMTSNKQDIWPITEDTETLAACLPGAELIEDFGNDKYVGRMQVALGPIRLKFIGDVHVIERDEDKGVVRALVEAADQSSGSVQAEVTLSLTPSEAGTKIHANARVYLTGRIAQFGRSLAEDASRDLFERFTQRLDSVAQGEEIQSENPPSAFAIATQIVKRRIAKLNSTFKRK